MHINVEKARKRSFIKSALIFLGLTVLVIFASSLLNFNYQEAIKAYPEALSWMLQEFYPNQQALKKLPHILEKLFDTVLMSVASSTMAGLIAFIFAICGAEATQFSKPIAWITKLIASFFRNVPNIVWSMILLFSFGMNIMTGFLALFLVTFGMLVRAYIETIDKSSKSSVEALTASGSNWWQIIGQGIFPNAAPGMISWTLYSIENNVRSATLIGMLTGSGIGHVFSLYYKSLDYHSCSLVVLTMIIVVLLIEALSNKVRRSVL